MKLQQIPKKIAERLTRHAYNLFGVDFISLAQICGRTDLKQIGSNYGGWVVPASIINKDSICYCVGCGEDISFDLGLIDFFGCDVFAFDPTPRSIKYVKTAAGQNQKYHFFDVGLWDKEDRLKFFVPKDPAHVSHSLLNLQKTDDYIYVDVKRLSRQMQELGHEKIDLLKIDIEGAEYKVIDTIIEDKIDIKILCVEYDEYFNRLDNNYKQRIRSSVKCLTENGYSLVYAQGNGNYTFVRNT